MREIKFRVWTGDEMLYEGWNNSFFATKQIIFRYEENIMQYTGLKDKNGKEIYEGDIIQYKQYWVNKRWWNNLSDIPDIEKECEAQRNQVHIDKKVVEFIDGGFRLDYSINMSTIKLGDRIKTGKTHWCDTEERVWDFEVIGNIYENPELLSSEQNVQASVATEDDSSTDDDEIIKDLNDGTLQRSIDNYDKNKLP